MANDGYLCGWRVRCDFPLPELTPWAGGDRPPDLTIGIGAVPDAPGPDTTVKRQLAIAGDGALLLTVPDVARYHIPTPDKVVIAPEPGADPAAIRVFLFGSVFAFLCHLRRLFPLHASCIAIDGRAYAFAGRSGAGKSTTALHFARRGHALLAEDVCVIDTAGSPRVLPSIARLKLHRDALDGAGIDPSGVAQVRRDADKYQVAAHTAFVAHPFPLGGIFLLEAADPGAGVRIEPVTRSAEAMATLDQHVVRATAAARLGRRPAVFAALTAIVGAVPVHRLHRPMGTAAFDEWIGAVETFARA